ncbi:MAG: hypothetical protein ACJAZF_003877, partial [Granulosicoccus sp.]
MHLTTASSAILMADCFFLLTVKVMNSFISTHQKPQSRFHYA